jgi:hypothetical protein
VERVALLQAMRLDLAEVQQQQARQDQAQSQQLAVQVMTHQHLEARQQTQHFTLAADQVVARQAVALQQARQRAQQTVLLTQVQVAAETMRQVQIMAALVAQVFC